MINRFALSFLCIELDRDIIFGVMLVYILLMNHIITEHIGCLFTVNTGMS